MKRSIVVYKSNFEEFYKSQDLKVQRKIDYVFDLVRFEERIPVKFFKHQEGRNI